LSTPFQNRLVGTVIVAAVAIIFLPDLLDGDKKTYQEEFERIPSAPKIDFKPEHTNFPTEKLAELSKEEVEDEKAVDDDESFNIKNTEEKQETVIEDKNLSDKESRHTDVKPTPEKATPNIAWVIQLGSFRHKNNVDELVRKLKNAGYTVFTKPIKTRTDTLTKVFVGPELIKSSLEKKIPELKKLTNVEGKVARFSPAK